MLRRILHENRVLILAILLGAAMAAAGYAIVVAPLETSVATADARLQSAERTLREAERDLKAARATLEGLERAKRDLAEFYRSVLPPDLSAAGRIAYLRLAQIARETNLRYERRVFDTEHVDETDLDALRVEMALAGGYDDIRRFLHRLESAPEFVLIDQVSIGAGRDDAAPLDVTIGVSTYFRTATDAR